MTCRCAPALVALRQDLDRMFPRRDRASDGCCGDAAHRLRKSDHNPDGSGYAHAHDFDEDTGQAGPMPLLWLKTLLLRDRRTKYVIYERRIAWPGGREQAYTGPNAHDHHLHLSILSTATHDTRLWLTPASKGPLMALSDAEQEEVLQVARRMAAFLDGAGGALDRNADGRMEHIIESVNVHTDMVVANAVGQNESK